MTENCPLRDPYYFPKIACKDEADCPGRSPCCRDMAGHRYCRPPRIQIVDRVDE